MKDIFKKVIKEFHEMGLPLVLPRETQLPLNSGKIISLIGPRRSGKTFMFFDTIKKIGNIEKAVYINFEDERYNIKATDLQYIYEAYLELYPDNKEIYFFFDEIQEIEGWEKFVRRMYDTITKNIFITGSSAKMLSKEIASNLRGRTITYDVYPLSFKEFLMFKNIKPQYVTTKEIANMRIVFTDFFERGGFPELFFTKKHFHKEIMNNYLDVMVFRDVVERYALQNTLAITFLLNKCVSSFAKEISINKLFNDMKSQGIKISKENVYQYIKYFEESYIALPLRKFSNKFTGQDIKKIYLSDHAFSKLHKFFTSNNVGRKLENIVYIQLLRDKKEPFYSTTINECDFIVKEGITITQAIQVCYELNENNKKREVAGLIDACKQHKLKKGLLLTYDQEEEFIQEEIKIIVQPVWKWLLK